ncbi:MAG: hypothetical protein FWC09_12245 [Lachnospiraceae bacterium]|nr:hypothetical protein [Lachnospiraceae bacterium]
MAKSDYFPEFYHREVSFCKVHGHKSKSVVESILLKNRISYFIDMHNESWLSRVFSAEKGKDRTVFIFRINEADIEVASELLNEFAPNQLTKLN